MKAPSAVPSAPLVSTCYAGAPKPCVRSLQELDYGAAYALLAEYPMRGVHLKSLLHDYGLTAPALRGRFFGYFANEQLLGIALLGHQILFCAPDSALPYFAQCAAVSGLSTSIIFGPRPQVEHFWHHYAAHGQLLKSQQDFAWYVCATPAQPLHKFQLVQATLEHLEVVLAAQAIILREASGIDPRQTDPVGFRNRVRERIERGRTWVRLAHNQVVFKAELQSVTPEAIYLEGIWTHPAHRQHGLARESVVELTHRRLRQQQVLCLAVAPEEVVAQRIYEFAGFRPQSHYQARYLHPQLR